MRNYPLAAVDRSAHDALNWLEDNKEGWPRSREQEDAETARRGYELYDDFEAPPILGYEQLEQRGLVVREKTVHKHGQERVHFVLVTTANVASNS